MTIADSRADPDAVLTTVKTSCRICLCFCGLDVTTDGEKIVRIRPDKDNPNNWRDFCIKGGSAGEMREHPKRITRPLKRVGDRYVAVSYEQAITEIAVQLNGIRERHGPDAIATYIGNPGMSNTSGAAFQAGFTVGLGSINNYTVGSVDQNSFNLNAREMYGCEMAMLYPDVDNARCMLLIGMNPAVSYVGWMYQVPDGWNRILAAQAAGADLIVVDPRVTDSSKKADTHVQIRPGEDWALLLAIIKIVFERGWEHEEDCAQASGVDILRAIAADIPLSYLAARCNVPIAQIEDIARRFATAETAVCVANTGVSHNRNGTIGEWLTHVLNLVTGRIDRPGGRVYNPGIFENGLAFLARLSSKATKRSRIGNFQPINNAFPLATLAGEIMTPGEGQVRALIINAGNPVVAGADGGQLDAALEQLECLIALDYFQRESHRHAHWIIPGTHFLEREDFFGVVSSMLERPYVQLSRAVIAPRDEVRHEWEFFRDLALAMDIAFMGDPTLNATIAQSKQAAEAADDPSLAFNPRSIWKRLVERSKRISWDQLEANPSGFLYGEKTHGHFRAQVQTPDGRIAAAPESFVAVLRDRLAEPTPVPDAAFPLQLVNQRHFTMMNSWLVEAVKRNVRRGDIVEINPVDASARTIQDGQRVTVRSGTGLLQAMARVTTDVPEGIVSMDHGWGSRLFDPVGGAPPEVQGVNRNQLVSADMLDELSGTPNLNGTPVEVEGRAG